MTARRSQLVVLVPPREVKPEALHGVVVERLDFLRRGWEERTVMKSGALQDEPLITGLPADWFPLTGRRMGLEANDVRSV